MPSTMAQYAANMACADETSSVIPEQLLSARLLMMRLTTRELSFLEQAQLASAGASDGQSLCVWSRG